MRKVKLLSPLLLIGGLAALPAWSASESVYTTASPVTGETHWATPDAVVVEVAPPALRVEQVPAARDGYVWAPGYWDYDGANYVWVDGRYVAEQPGMAYVAPRWEASNGRYALSRERWTPNPLGNRARANPLVPSAGQ